MSSSKKRGDDEEGDSENDSESGTQSDWSVRDDDDDDGNIQPIVATAPPIPSIVTDSKAVDSGEESENVEVVVGADGLILCGICEDVVCVSECINCVGVFCEGCCTQLHSKGIMKKHVIRALETAGVWSVPSESDHESRGDSDTHDDADDSDNDHKENDMLCPLHRREPMSVWCLTCTSSSCALCFLDGPHAGHAHQTLKAKRTQDTQVIEVALNQGKMIQKRISEVLDALPTLTRDIIEGSLKKQREVKDRIAALHSILAQREAELVADIKAMEERKLVALQTQSASLKARQRELDDGLEAASVLCYESSMTVFMSEWQSALQTFNDLLLKGSLITAGESSLGVREQRQREEDRLVPVTDSVYPRHLKVSKAKKALLKFVLFSEVDKDDDGGDDADKPTKAKGKSSKKKDNTEDPPPFDNPPIDKPLVDNRVDAMTQYEAPPEENVSSSDHTLTSEDQTLARVHCTSDTSLDAPQGDVDDNDKMLDDVAIADAILSSSDNIDDSNDAFVGIIDIPNKNDAKSMTSEVRSSTVLSNRDHDSPDDDDDWMRHPSKNIVVSNGMGPKHEVAKIDPTPSVVKVQARDKTALSARTMPIPLPRKQDESDKEVSIWNFLF